MSERPTDDPIVKQSQAVIDRVKAAVEMNQDQLDRLQAERDERREREQSLESLLSPPSQPEQATRPAAGA